MFNKVIDIKDKYNKLSTPLKILIKISLTFIFTCLIASFTCFILKDFSNNYIFFYKLSEELLLAARSCAGLGLIFGIISIKAKLQ